MKTALITLGLTAVFFGSGVVAMKMLAPPAETSLTDEASIADSTATSGVACAPDSATVAPLAADVQEMQDRLARAEAQADSLRRVMGEHQEAATLTRREDEALQGIVQRLDGRSFVKLYHAATSRNQGRLLGALTPAQAAAFVRTQLPGGRSAPVQATSSRNAAGGGVADSTSAE